VKGTACPNCWVEIYSDRGDEGEVYEGYTTADSGGNFSWTGSIRGPNVTALAIDQSTLNTSPFSSPLVNACSQVYLPLVLRNR